MGSAGVQASQYQQDYKALEQVFEFIMHSLANYRALYQKVLQLSREGLALIDGKQARPLPRPTLLRPFPPANLWWPTRAILSFGLNLHRQQSDFAVRCLYSGVSLRVSLVGSLLNNLKPGLRL